MEIANNFRKFRITEGKFFLPPSLSPEAQDLLKCMLSVDPIKRIKLQEIRVHPWVLTYTHPKDMIFESLSIELLEKMNEVDEDILKQILKFKFNFGGQSIEGIIQAIKENKGDDYVVAYNLLKSEKYKQKLEEIFQKTLNSSKTSLSFSYDKEPSL